VILASDSHKAVIRLTWNQQKKTWLLTAYEKGSPQTERTSDISGHPAREQGRPNDTAPRPEGEPDSSMAPDTPDVDSGGSERYSLRQRIAQSKPA
jgi:hypothetical protein